MTIKSLFNQASKASTAYKAEFMLDNAEFKALCAIRSLSTDQLAAIAAIKNGTATRQDCSTVINAMRLYKRIIAPTSDLKSKCAASI